MTAPEAEVPELGDDTGSFKRVKIVVVGDGAVGKTCLLICYATGQFPTEYVPTVFANYTAKKEIQGQTVILHLWDTAGQEEYDRLRPLSYPGADVILMCFSTVSQGSFDAVTDKWAPEVAHFIPDVPIILVGTKLDMREEKCPDPNSGKFEPILTPNGEELAKQLKAHKYLECSSKTGEGLEKVFTTAMDIVLSSRPATVKDDHKPDDKSTRKKDQEKKKKGCILF